MRSLGRSWRGRLRFDYGNETGDRIASFEQPSHLLDLFRLKGPFNDGGQEVERLTTEKVHGTERFQEHRGRSSHAPFHHCIGDSFKQRVQVDVRAGYRRKIGNDTLELFLDAYNLTNRANFDNPASDRRIPSTFLILTTLRGGSGFPRQAQFGVRYAF